MNIKGIEFMFPYRPVLNLVHLIQFLLELHKVSCLWSFIVQQSIFELLQSVNHLQEVSLTQEEVEVFCLNFGQNSVNREQESVLLEVLAE